MDLRTPLRILLSLRIYYWMELINIWIRELTFVLIKCSLANRSWIMFAPGKNPNRSGGFGFLSSPVMYKKAVVLVHKQSSQILCYRLEEVFWKWQNGEPQISDVLCLSVCHHFLEFRASDFTILKKCAKLLARGSWWRCILFVGIHRSDPDQKSAKLFFITSYWQQYHFFMVPVADSKMFRCLESCSGVLFQWIELIHDAQVLASGLSTFFCDSISGFEGLTGGNCCVCATFNWIRAVRIREVDRLVLAKQISSLGEGRRDSLDPFRNTVKPP